MAAISKPIALPIQHNDRDYSMHDPGSYTGSSGPFNPASYTRHFLGSPVSWHGGSFGRASAAPASYGSRFLAGSPAEQLLNSLDANDFNRVNRLLSSPDASSLINAQSIFDRESDICRNYNCCGLKLTDLHALLEHFEDVHIIPKGPDSSQSTSSQNPPPPKEQSQQLEQHYPSAFDPEDMDLELELEYPEPAYTAHSSPSSGGPTPPDTPLSTPLSAYPSPNAFSQNNLPYHPLPNMHSPYLSQPPSPLSSTCASTRQSSPTGRPNLNLNLSSFSRSSLSSPAILNPEDAFNPYARFSSDYSSCMPGAQFNGATMDEASVNPAVWSHAQQQNQGQCVPPALLFSSSTSVSPTETPDCSRVPSPTAGYVTVPLPLNQTQSMPVTPITSNTQSPTAAKAPLTKSASNSTVNSSNISLPPTSLLPSKPFKCPKENCNKSYKQANGLKYHMTHGSCNFAPPKDLEHVKELLERKRREATASGLTRSNSLQEGERSYNYGELGNITETELREVEREAERRLRPFACGVGECQRRYKNMNGLRYHYQHSGDHGAVGLALLASGQHECLHHGNRSRAHHNNQPSSSTSGSNEDGRKRSVAGMSLMRAAAGGFKGSASVPVSRAASRNGTPQPVAVPVTVHYSASGSSAANSTTTSTTRIQVVNAPPVTNGAASTTPTATTQQQQQQQQGYQHHLFQFAQIQQNQYQHALHAVQQQQAQQQQFSDAQAAQAQQQFADAQAAAQNKSAVASAASSPVQSTTPAAVFIPQQPAPIAAVDPMYVAVYARAHQAHQQAQAHQQQQQQQQAAQYVPMDMS